LTIHRLLDAVLLGRKPQNDFGELAVLGEHCSDRERRAEAAERELTKVKLLNYLAPRIGEHMDAVVTGVEEFGLFVQGVKLPAEGLVSVASLSDDYYRYDRASHTLSGHRLGNCYRLGDAVRVAVARVDVDRRELDFRIVGRNATEGRSAAPSMRARGTGKRPSKHKGKGGARRDKSRPKKRRR
jgi:ribonuclease R